MGDRRFSAVESKRASRQGQPLLGTVVDLRTEPTRQGGMERMVWGCGLIKWVSKVEKNGINRTEEKAAPGGEKSMSKTSVLGVMWYNSGVSFGYLGF